MLAAHTPVNSYNLVWYLGIITYNAARFENMKTVIAQQRIDIEPVMIVAMHVAYIK